MNNAAHEDAGTSMMHTLTNHTYDARSIYLTCIKAPMWQRQIVCCTSHIFVLTGDGPHGVVMGRS